MLNPINTSKLYMFHRCAFNEEVYVVKVLFCTQKTLIILSYGKNNFCFLTMEPAIIYSLYNKG